MNLRLAVGTAILAIIAIPAFGLPDYGVWTRYYNEQGQEVGDATLLCNGSFTRTGTQTDLYTEEYSACPSTVDPFTCPDVGLEATDCAMYCVTLGYKEAVETGMIDDAFGCISRP